MEEKGKSKRKRLLKLSMIIASLSVLLVTAAVAFTFLAVTPVIAQEAEVTNVTVNAPEYVEKGKTFVATIDVVGVTDFSAGNFDLSFDSSVVEVSDVKEGEIKGEVISISMCDLLDADTVGVNIKVEPFGKKCVSGSGYLAEIEFDVIGGEEGEESELKFAGVMDRLYNINAEKIPANWINATFIIGVPVEEEEEEEEEEEVGEEVIPGSPNITACKPAEEVVSNAVGESKTFNITVNQIADISWQINGTEVQTNESVTEAVFTNKSADIGTWNVSAIATNTTTGLSDMHTWIWSVTLTPIATVTPMPMPTLAPEVTPTPETETEGTPTPQEKKIAPKEKTTPVPAATPTPKPAVPGFEAIFAIAVILGITYRKMRKGKKI